MKSINYEHAAQRKTFVGSVYERGSKTLKESILNGLDIRFSQLHREGRVHLHDLEAYGTTYNCLTPNILAGFPFDMLQDFTDQRKILEFFEYFRKIIVGLGNEQSGGIGFANFDIDVETICGKLNLPWDDATREFLSECIDIFLKWVNDARDRCGEVQYYVTLNLGLGTGEKARFITATTLSRFMKSKYIRPNIIFKVKSGINSQKGDPNYDLFTLAKECTCRRMIPTYCLCDSPHNRNLDPQKLALMGCRTKVYQNEHGESTTIGKSNIVYTTINLPRIALDLNAEKPSLEIEEKVRLFKEKWYEIADIVKDQLFDRYYKICRTEPDDFPCNYQYNLMHVDIHKVTSMDEVFKHGTLAVGFIGLSEAVELLTGQKYYATKENHEIALDIVKTMRERIDRYRKEYKMNFSLLATSGEFISGRLPGLDKSFHAHAVNEKGYYTNSFHVEVDSRLNPFQKISFEGPFHKYCNGGCITYIEFRSAPLSNVEAISELIDHAIQSDVNYLGFNFPMDTCRDCGTTGTFDSCTKCGSGNIQRIRRVSGYLEDADFFTPGKKAELAHRKPNA